MRPEALGRVLREGPREFLSRRGNVARLALTVVGATFVAAPQVIAEARIAL